MLPIAIVALVITTLANLIMPSKLAEHRTDVPRSADLGDGPSRSWQINVFVHAENDAAGKPIKRFLVAGLCCQVFLFIAVASLWH